MNQYESACLADSFASKGFEISGWDKECDFGLLNSCALTKEAEAKSKRALSAFLKNSPQAQVIITGCYAQTNWQDFLQYPQVKWIVGNGEKLRTVDIVLGNPAQESAQIFSKELPQNIDALSVLPQCDKSARLLDDRMNLKIQDGCDNACAYCIIPRARGLPRSRALKDILQEAKNLTDRGVAEIVLTGINLVRFALPETSLIDLIDALNDIPKLKRLRLGSIEPINLPIEDIVLRCKEPSHKLSKFLHIPMQSGSEKVLERMRRPYTAKYFFDLLNYIASNCENMGLGTDVICGHHGEGDAEFEETFNAIKNSPLTHLHVFKFSEREKTLSRINTKESIAESVRKLRADKLRILAKEKHFEFVGKLKNKEVCVLLENRLQSGEYLGFSDEYLKVAVKIPTLGLKNRLAKVRIESALGVERVQAAFLEMV